MNSSHAFPVFLSLAGKHCVVAGMGDVGHRKSAALLAAGLSSLLALDALPETALPEQSRKLLQDKRVRFANRAFAETDAVNASLVFAATSNPDENSRIAAICKKANVLCNSITAPDEGDFILPATARQGALCAALSTAGQSPLLARQWRLELENWLKPREKLAWLLGRLRGPILALGNDQAFNAAIFRRIAESPIPHWLEYEEIGSCQAWLTSELPESLHGEIKEILAEYADVFA